MTTLMSDDGTGKTDGTVWDTAKWISEGTSTGGTATYQTSALRIQSGSAGGYSGAAKVSRSVNITSVADVDISGTFVIDANEPYGQICIRATTSTIDYNNGYSLVLNKNGTLYIDKMVSFSGTHLASQTKTLVAGTTYGFRFQASGTTIRARTWTGAEPGTWDLSVTDSTFTAAGKTGISIGAGNAAVNHRFTFDDIVVTDVATAVSVSETVTGTDALSVRNTLATVTETVTSTDAISVAATAFVSTVTETTTATDGSLDMTAAVPVTETPHALDSSLSVLVNPATVTETVTSTDALSLDVSLPVLTETIVTDDLLTAVPYYQHHDLVTEIEFTPDEWTDISAYVPAEVESVGTFGRPTRFDDVAASTWDVTLRNSDGRFTPGNPAGAYYPNVAKGKQIRVSVTYAGQNYPRFWGRISGITMPNVVSVDDAVVRVQASDIMSTLARRTLQSPFVEESRRQARINSGGGVDVFPFPTTSVKSDGSIQVADTSFENKGTLFPSSTRMGSVSVMSSGNGAGTVKSASIDSDGGVLSEGQLDFEVGDNGFGKQAHPILVCKPQVGFQQFELFFKIPEGVLPPRFITGTHTVSGGQNWNTVPPIYGMTTAELASLNPDVYPTALAVGQVLNISNSVDDSEWILADLWSGSTEVLRIVLGNQAGKLVIAAKKPAGGAQYIYNSLTLADNKWRKLTIFKDAANSFRSNINDAPSGSAMTGLAADLTAVDTVYVGGRNTIGVPNGQQVQCPPCSVGGISFQKTRNGVWYYYALGAPPANITARERFVELSQYAYPVNMQVGVAWHASLNLPFDTKVVRTNITGRSVLDCMQELARTVGGYLWVQPADGYLTMRKGPTPPVDLVTVDLVGDADMESPPAWQDTVDVQPTRVTAKCPAGEVTSINTAAETAGQYKDATVETCAATIAAAKAVADRILSGQSTLHLTNLQVDMVHAAGALWGSFLNTFLPSERALHITSVPEAVIGYSTTDAVVESWVESYTVDTARFSFDTTPIGSTTTAPALASFTVTSTSGVQTNGAVVAAQPSGTASGDLLLGIMTVDNTGSIAGMSPPSSSWTAQGAGGTASSGFGQVWTKVAGAAEPTTYAFSVNGSAGITVLVTDDFTGTNAAVWNTAKWATGTFRTGASATIQSNKGVLNAGTIASYGGRASMKAVGTIPADVDFTGTFTYSVEGRGSVILRGDSGLNGVSGYELTLSQSGTLTLSKGVASVFTTLATMTMTLANATAYKFRFQAIGSTIRARVWLASSSEATSWPISVTDTSISTTGALGFALVGGGAAGSIITIDDVTISDPNAISSWPEAKLSLLRIAGASTSSPILTAPSWTATTGATTSHSSPTVTPASTGLLVNHWHMLTGASSSGGSGGGGGGAATAFNFGTSGFNSAAEITAYNAWLTNHSLKAITHWTDSTVASQQGAAGVGSGTYAAWTGILQISVGGIFSQANGGESGGDTWAHAASGTYDARWTTALNNIKAAWGSRTPQNLHISFAHEFNGSWFYWKVANADTTNFKLAWIRFANLVRSIIPGAQMVWNPNDGTTTSQLTHVDDAYPGTAYVDVIGVDSYNAYPHVNTLAAWTSKTTASDASTNPLGIEAWRQYALTKGKPLAVPEWGNPYVDTGGGAGGGDAPDYAARFINWCKTNGGFGAGQVKYASYFNIGTSGGYAADYLIWASGSNGTVHQPLTATAIKDNA